MVSDQRDSDVGIDQARLLRGVQSLLNSCIEYTQAVNPLKIVGIVIIAAAVIVVPLGEESGTPTHGGDPKEPAPAPLAQTVYFTSVKSDMSAIPKWLDTFRAVQRSAACIADIFELK
jgi:hypothetical protein